MLSLKPVDFTQISRYFQDFQRHSKCFEMPPESSRILGIFDYQDKLVGYFILVCYKDYSVLIHQGYLIPEARHKGYPKKAMLLLEKRIKDSGLKKIRLQTKSRFRSYTDFIAQFGFKPETITYFKEVV